VTISHVSTIESSIPSGVSVDQLKAAITSAVCGGNMDCQLSAARRRALGGMMSHGRLLETTASFTVTQTFNASSEVSLAAPTVDTAAVATDLGISASDISTTSTLDSVEASVTVVSEGSASSTEAQAAVSTQSALPTALASSLGVDSTAFTFTATPTIIGPPMPPPTQPPLPLSPPVLSPPLPRMPAIGQPFPPSVTLQVVGENEGALSVSDKSSDDAVIIVIVVAGGAALAILFITILVVVRRRKREMKSAATTIQAQEASVLHQDLALTSMTTHGAMHTDFEATSASGMEVHNDFEVISPSDKASDLEVTVQMPSFETNIQEEVRRRQAEQVEQAAQKKKAEQLKINEMIAQKAKAKDMKTKPADDVTVQMPDAEGGLRRSSSEIMDGELQSELNALREKRFKAEEALKEAKIQELRVSGDRTEGACGPSVVGEGSSMRMAEREREIQLERKVEFELKRLRGQREDDLHFRESFI